MKCVVIWLTLCVAIVTGNNRALLQDVQVLTFTKGKLSAYRRSSPVPQIKCVGGEAEGLFEPEVIVCRNMGLNDQQKVQWQCKAELPKGLRLGTTTVTCEGYTGANDPHILAGSCGVEYTLHGSIVQPKVERGVPGPMGMAGRDGKDCRWDDMPDDIPGLRKAVWYFFLEAIIASLLPIGIVTLVWWTCQESTPSTNHSSQPRRYRTGWGGSDSHHHHHYSSSNSSHIGQDRANYSHYTPSAPAYDHGVPSSSNTVTYSESTGCGSTKTRGRGDDGLTLQRESLHFDEFQSPPNKPPDNSCRDDNNSRIQPP